MSGCRYGWSPAAAAMPESAFCWLPRPGYCGRSTECRPPVRCPAWNGSPRPLSRAARSGRRATPTTGSGTSSRWAIQPPRSKARWPRRSAGSMWRWQTNGPADPGRSPTASAGDRDVAGQVDPGEGRDLQVTGAVRGAVRLAGTAHPYRVPAGGPSGVEFAEVVGEEHGMRGSTPMAAVILRYESATRLGPAVSV